MTLRFSVDGSAVEARDGCTVAVAMLDAGIHRFRTSVRGEPRAPLCAMGVCHECRVTIDGIAHQRACLVPVRSGMAVSTHPSSAIAPASALEKHVADVGIVGAGPAGIAAAIIAAERGARVVLLDENERSGGQIWRNGPGAPAPPRAQQLLQRLARTPARVLHGATVTHVEQREGTFTITAERGGTPVHVQTSSIVLATGARELFLPFPGSTLPNVVGIGALQALLKGGFDVRGRRIVIAGTGPLLLPVAAMARAKGARLELVAEQASFTKVLQFAAGLVRHPSAIAQAMQYRAGFLGTPYRTGTWVSRADGQSAVERVELTNGVSRSTHACDVLAVAHGLIGNTELARHLGCRVENGSVVVDDAQCTNIPRVFCAGEPTGVGGVDLALLEGEAAGAGAVGLALSSAQRREIARLRRIAQRMHVAFSLRDELKSLALPDTIVCRCEDVRMSALHPNWPMRKAKLYTRAGMGACQGRTCGGALEYLYSAGADSVRAPVQPARVSTLAAASADTEQPYGEPSDG